MTREEHLSRWQYHRSLAANALRDLKKRDAFDADLFSEYKEQSALANKYRGIANAMATRKMRRKFRECGIII